MIIESCSTNKNGNLKRSIAKKVFTFTAYSLLIAFGAITTITVIGQNSKKPPTGNYLSPLPTGEIAQDPSPTEPVDLKTTPELINLAQNYLDKAFQLSKTTKQTPELKNKIIENLDQSLSFTTQVINQDPRNPKGYLLRAQILTAVSTQNPSALTQAQKDLETAQGLSQGQPITLPKSINPLNLLPDQQAVSSSDIILAAPHESTSSTASGQLGSNSFTTQIILPTGQQDLLVTDQRINDSSYIYLIPEDSNNISVFVKSKGQGQFTIGTSTTSETNTVVNYYIITP